MARIAVVHVPFFSHIEAAMRLTRVLVRQGHDVIAWAPEAWREQVESDGDVLFYVHDPEMPQTHGFMNFVAALAETTEQCTGPLVEQLFAETVDLVVHDSQVPWARIAGDYLGLPRIVSHPMFPIIAAARKLNEDEEEPEPEDHEEAEAKARFDARWLSIAGTWGVELGELGSVIHSTSVSDTTVAFTTEEILGGPGLDGWHCIGPLMDEVPPAAPSGDRPLVYACLGTSFNTRRLVFRTLIEGLADEPVDVLISTGNGTITAADLGPLPPNVEVRDFVAGREVLARARLHITHGGCNSVHESLLAGVPMLLMPQAFDQFPLASRIERLGAGLVVDETPAAVRTAARWLVEDETVQALTRELGQHLASYDGESRVAAVVEQVLSESAALSP